MSLEIKQGEVSLSANGTGTIYIDVDAGRKFTVHMIGRKSTGSFKITDIKNSATGESYLTGVLYSEMFSRYSYWLVLPVPQEFTGPTRISIQVVDTSGSSNTVSLTFVGEEVSV